jgi:hypothetical protein
VSETMNRPKCEWQNGDDCQRPATWVVTFTDNYRSHLSCEDHLDRWNKAKRGVYFSELRGYEAGASIEEILAEN